MQGTGSVVFLVACSVKRVIHRGGACKSGVGSPNLRWIPWTPCIARNRKSLATERSLCRSCCGTASSSVRGMSRPYTHPLLVVGCHAQRISAITSPFVPPSVPLYPEHRLCLEQGKSHPCRPPVLLVGRDAQCRNVFPRHPLAPSSYLPPRPGKPPTSPAWRHASPA